MQWLIACLQAIFANMSQIACWHFEKYIEAIYYICLYSFTTTYVYQSGVTVYLRDSHLSQLLLFVVHVPLAELSRVSLTDSASAAGLLRLSDGPAGGDGRTRRHGLQRHPPGRRTRARDELELREIQNGGA